MPLVAKFTFTMLAIGGCPGVPLHGLPGAAGGGRGDGWGAGGGAGGVELGAGAYIYVWYYCLFINVEK
jgi:hypothetical protein